MTDSYSFEPVGLVRSPYPEKFGIPRQPGLAPNLVSKIKLLGEFNNPDTRGAVIFNFAFANSRFDVEWTEDGRTISQTIQYDNFVVEDISTSVENREGRAWARMDVAGITGNMRIEDISLGSGPGSVLGTVGFGGLTVDPNSFVSISGH